VTDDWEIRYANDSNKNSYALIGLGLGDDGVIGDRKAMGKRCMRPGVRSGLVIATASMNAA
jgi:hypothetical protein